MLCNECYITVARELGRALRAREGAMPPRAETDRAHGKIGADGAVMRACARSRYFADDIVFAAALAVVYCVAEADANIVAAA